MVVRVVFHLFLLSKCDVFVNGVAYASVTALYDKLTSFNYTYVRPAASSTIATPVSLRFYLVNLQSLDEGAGKFSVSGFFEIKWNDHNMTWNSASYDNAEWIKIPTEYMWKPYFLVGNPYEDSKVLSLTDSTVRVFQNGDAEWYPADGFEMACDADVSFYPFDSQTCEIWLLPWQQGTDEINVTLLQNTVNTTYFSNNPTWDYVESDVSTNNLTNGIHFKMTFKRRPAFFMLNIIFPIILLGFLNVFVFVLPADSGERVGFSITLLLSIAVFMTIVADSMPSNTSPRISSVGIKLCVDLVISSLIVVCTIFSLVVHHREDSIPINGFWKRLLTVKYSCCSKKKSKVSDMGTIDVEHNKKIENKETKDQANWKDVSRAMDMYFMTIFCVVLVMANLGFFMDIIVGIS